MRRLLRTGVDKLLLRQRGEELQRICDEILAKEPQKGRQNGLAKDGLKESGWLACLLPVYVKQETAGLLKSSARLP